MISAEVRDVARQVLQIVPLVMRVVAAELRNAPHEIVPAHYRLLHMLCQGPRNLSDMAEMQAVSLPTMSNTIDTLEQRGWVTRTRSTDDRRVVVVALTPAGRHVLEVVEQQAEERLAVLLSGLSDEERLMLAEGLSILRRAFAGTTQGEAKTNQRSMERE